MNAKTIIISVLCLMMTPISGYTLNPGVQQAPKEEQNLPINNLEDKDFSIISLANQPLFKVDKNIEQSILKIFTKDKPKSVTLDLNDEYHPRIIIGDDIFIPLGEEIKPLDEEFVIAKKIADHYNLELTIINKKPNLSKVTSNTVSTFQGMASWYGPGFHGRRTASGERFDQYALTAAHKTLPFGTQVRVTNLRNGQSVIVRINDRGPYSHGREIDLSKGSAQQIGLVSAGVGMVKLEILDK